MNHSQNTADQLRRATPAELARLNRKSNRVITRAWGDIPGCRSAGPATCLPFDQAAYDAKHNRFVKDIRDYIAHMDQVRAGMIEAQEAA